MKLLKKGLLVSLVLILRMPALGQVQKVEMRTTGISCGFCAAVSEVYLRQLKTVDQITISLSREAIIITYKPEGVFQPRELRDALMKTDVGVTQFQISARGRVQEQGGKRFFLAGKDKFAVINSPAASQVSTTAEISVDGIVDDKAAPMELRILAFKFLKP